MQQIEEKMMQLLENEHGSGSEVPTTNTFVVHQGDFPDAQMAG